MSTVDANRFNPLSPADLDALRESTLLKPKAPALDRNSRDLCEVPKSNQSALPYLVGGRDPNVVNQDEVEAAVSSGRTDTAMGTSSLARSLRSPFLNREERNLVVQRLAREGDARAFYANHNERMYVGDSTALREDERVIANAVQTAFASGAIDTKDLLRIADANLTPNGAQAFMATMRLGAGATAAGSATQSLADALWTRNGADGKDRAAAAMYYSSDPGAMARGLDTPDKRAAAFEAVVDFNRSNPYQLLPNSVTKDWQNDVTLSAGRLFAAHGQELMDRYTNVTPPHGVQTEPLAKFFGQTLLNPEAKGMTLDRQRDLIPTIRATLGNAADTYLNRAATAAHESPEQILAMEQLGRLSAAVAGGSAVALTDYSAKVAGKEAAAKQVADLLSGAVGALTGRLTPYGKPLEKGFNEIAQKLVKAMQEQPERPNDAFSGVLNDELHMHIEGLEKQVKNPRLSNYFEGVQGNETLQVYKNLGINPGGYAK